MSAGYVVARENFKEAGKHVSAEADPVMFNLLFGLQSLTNQIEADFASLLAGRPHSASPASTRKLKAKRKSSSTRKARKRTRRG